MADKLLEKCKISFQNKKILLLVSGIGLAAKYLTYNRDM
jgi:hypothetical protein